MDNAYPSEATSDPPIDTPTGNRNRRLVLTLGVVVLLILAGIAYVASRDSASSNPAAGAGNATTQAVEGGNVTVEVTWAGVVSGPVFDVVLDTHSVDLDSLDLTTLAVLRVDGTAVQPVSWDAPKGGHHREGTLVFLATNPDGSALIDAETTTVELVVRDVAGIAERTFAWNP